MGVFELYLGFSMNQDNVAHFAHLGGAIFGFLMISYWRRTGERF
jgi:rhomboid-like protein